MARAAQDQTAQPPNVVLVFMDDMGYGDMGCMGGSVVKTPRMDSVASKGVTFRQMYSAAPVCTPSRAALLTGRYPQRVGLPRVLFPEHEDGLSSWEVTVADLLRRSDYRTGVFGKWHLGAHPEHNPLRHGFDEFFGLPYSNDMDPVALYAGEKVVEAEIDQAQLTRRYTDEVIDFVERNQDRPFFAYLAHTMPHIPLHVEEDFRGTSLGGTYGDTIECIDYHLGRILDRLDELDLTDNTLVIVTSDNGPWFEGSTGGLRGRKIDVFEGGIRMPFVAQWPTEIPASSVREEPACFIDLLPTLVSLAGGQLPDDRVTDGVDLSSALRGGEMPDREALYFFHHWSLNAVRSGRWKLHVARDPGADRRELPQLFDMELDPGESYNVANREPDALARLSHLASRFGDEIAQQRRAAEQRAAERTAR